MGSDASAARPVPRRARLAERAMEHRAWQGVIVDFDWSVIAGALPALFKGAQLTVLITVCGLVGGTLLGVAFGLMRAYGGRMLSSLGWAYVGVGRGVFLWVPGGLAEAGLAMGLPHWRVLAFVVGPVAFRRMTPALGNQFIVSLKDTSLFIVIGVGELTRQGQEIMATNFRAVEIWTAVAVIYLLLIGVLTLGLRVLEKRMRIL